LGIFYDAKYYHQTEILTGAAGSKFIMQYQSEFVLKASF